MDLPEKLKGLEALKGSEWSKDDRDRFATWMLGAGRRYFVALAAACLGPQIDSHHVEDALSKFYLQKLDGIIRAYAPAPERSLLPYINTCLQNLCRSERKRILLNWRRATTMTKPGADGEEDVDMEFVAEDSDYNADEGLFAKQCNKILSACLNKLPARLRDLVQLRYFRDLDYEQIASLVGAAVGTVRVQTLRARQALLKCLVAHGLDRELGGLSQ